MHPASGFTTLRDMDLTNVPADLLNLTPQGSWRIAGTRVSLDSLIAAFWAGATPEEICQDLPSLSRAQVYRMISYYLADRAPIDHYFQAQRHAADQCRLELEKRQGDCLATLRQRLRAGVANPPPRRPKA